MFKKEYLIFTIPASLLLGSILYFLVYTCIQAGSKERVYLEKTAIERQCEITKMKRPEIK